MVRCRPTNAAEFQESVLLCCRRTTPEQRPTANHFVPIWHTKEERVLAHIFVCFLAYVLWKTLAQLCDKAGLGSEPRRVLSELSDIRSMDVVLPTRSGVEIRTRCVSKPTDHQQILLEKLRLKLPSKIIQKKM